MQGFCQRNAVYERQESGPISDSKYSDQPAEYAVCYMDSSGFPSFFFAVSGFL